MFLFVEYIMEQKNWNRTFGLYIKRNENPPNH